MERTLRRMEEVRRNDNMKLRDLIISKREWVLQEKKKGSDIIKHLEDQKAKLTEQQEAIKPQLIKLEGCLLVLDDLLAEDKKIQDNDKKVEELKEAEEKSKTKTNTKRKYTRRSTAKSNTEKD